MQKIRFRGVDNLCCVSAFFVKMRFGLFMPIQRLSQLVGLVS
jgi:hypothetical protein